VAPHGVGAVAGLPANAGYRDVAFSPDGKTLWASPSAAPDEDTAWQSSDAVDLSADARRAGRRWDTGVVEHPGGGLVVTLSSDQGATDMLFARPGDGVPARMRVFRHAIILEVDGYETPVFSPDGRYLAIRGNAYVQSLDVFEFPTLHHLACGNRSPFCPTWTWTAPGSLVCSGGVGSGLVHLVDVLCASGDGSG
jgi:hypothetical protein